MKQADLGDFRQRFQSLTNFKPLRWQCRLFSRFLDDDVPDICDLPTGLGKTSVIPIWLLAVVSQAEAGKIRLPRRLAYVVNRRTVVDQATEVVEEMRERLMNPEAAAWSRYAPTLEGISNLLRRLCAAEGFPLAVSTLRGELADNEEWKSDPARPAIIIGTVDMIGSKLLFSGYGDGMHHQPHHAGLIGYDALMIHDEAHLTPAYGGLLREVAAEQDREAQRGSDPGGVDRTLRVLELSATQREETSGALTFEEEDLLDPFVRGRIEAGKRLEFHAVDDGNVAGKIVRLALKYQAAMCKIVVYIQSPDRAQEIHDDLANEVGDNRVALLTGTLRGYERDRLLVTDRVYRTLLDPDLKVDATVYLVSTSAGEVGIDLDADHLICDVTSLDSLIQRLGRVNRRGRTNHIAQVDLFAERPGDTNGSDFQKAVAATIKLLRKWQEESEDRIDVSPIALRRRLASESAESLQSAFSPVPDAPPLTDILLDAWSLTSVRSMPGRSEVAAFLHGFSNDPPETFVSWRREVTDLAEADLRAAELGHWFSSCRIEAHERLRDRTDRIREELGQLLRNHQKENPEKDFPVVVLNERGEASWSNLSRVVEKNAPLAYRTVVLPASAGGLSSSGAFDPSRVDSGEVKDLDVAERADGDGRRRERWLHYREDTEERWEHLLTGQLCHTPPSELRETRRVTLRHADEGTPELEPVEIVLFLSPSLSALQDPETTSSEQRLRAHAEQARRHMESIASKLLPSGSPIGAGLVEAADSHDRGKDRPIWQRYAFNEDGAEPVAKAPRYRHWRALCGYRHEFGSVLEGLTDPAIGDAAERDLILHLIAAHHGRARPHFEPKAYDTTHSAQENERAAVDAMRRFARLQQRYGRWGLAWMESLLRCADIAASRQASAPQQQP